MGGHMRRKAWLLALCAATSLAACAPKTARESAADPTRGFVSDRISVVTRGAGPDIILIPGLASHRDVWAGVADSLDDRYRLHLLQLNGFAGAQPGANVDGPVSAPVAQEVARYIRESGLQRPAIIGHSMGGTIGMMLAARDTGSVGRLMVVDMTPFMGVMFGPAAATPEGLRKIADGMRDTILAQPIGSNTSMLEQMVSGMTRVPAMRNTLLQGLRDSHKPTVANAFRELVATDLRPELARITAPVTVLYVHPTNIPLKPAVFDAATRQSWTTLRNVRLVKIEDSNHFIQMDQPGRFVAEVDAFMRR
jgi:pimeloyl-ACP methyl ester carboxylesterase